MLRAEIIDTYRSPSERFEFFTFVLQRKPFLSLN